MAYANGFTYIEGPVKYVLSTISSTCTVKGRNPVTLSDDRTVIEAASDTTAIYGIAAHDAANSVYAGKMLVEIPTADTLYAVKIATDASASEISIGQAIDIEKSGDYLIGNEDSQTSPMLVIVPRQDGTIVDSADSTVFVHWLGNVLGVYSSNASVSGAFAQD